jgi:Putative Ig domain
VRFVIVLALVVLGAAVTASVAAALRFADAPCIESGGGGVRVCPQGTVGGQYSVQMEGASGCGPALPYQYRVVAGSLPSGLSLASSGLISGTPNGAGTANFWVELSDENPPSQSWCVPTTAEREFSITIIPGFRIDNTVTTKYWSISQSQSDQLTASIVNAVPPPSDAPKANATWSVVSGALPPGVTLSPTGLLAGTPTVEGVYTFKVMAVSGGSSDDETFVVDVKRAVQIAAPATQPRSEVSVPYELDLSATGGSGTYTWGVDGTLPSGVTFDATDSTLSGTPTAAGTYTYTATATDPYGRVGSYQGRIVVAAKLAFVAPRPKAGRVGRMYALKLRTTGGVAPVAWKLKRGPLPRGIRFTKTLGQLGGKPTRAGRYRITVEATDALKVKSTTSFTIVVLPARKA